MIGQTVSHYRVVSKLGAGGMGVVYEAEDTRLHRRVALKFLAEDAVADHAAVQRFKRESEAASALNHPHICTIYDIGEHDGHPYIVMEKLDGVTLRHLLRDEPLPLDRVLALGGEIADGLGAAHAAGIVHRDVKPANIFVTTRGEAKLLDFGLARVDAQHAAASTSDSPTRVLSEDLTNPGTTLGTVAYMSPEQARGEPVDARSDLFSLGVVLYEMATGRTPFRGHTPAAIFSAILNEAPLPPSRANPDVPHELDRLILSALEKQRDLRVQSAAEIRVQLLRLRRDTSSGRTAPAPVGPARTTRRFSITAAAVSIVVVLGALWVFNRRDDGNRAAGLSTHNAPVATEKRIAVLPFENLGTAADAYFTDGITDEVRGKLATIRGLAVIARASSNDYKQTEKKPSQIAKELSVRYLLTGTVRWQKSGDVTRIRLSPELVEIASAGAPVTRWQQTYDADLSDIFEVQARIATQVAEALQIALGETQARQLEQPPTSNLAAYDAYLRGVAIFSRGFAPATQREAAEQFERAVALDPNFAMAWAYLSLSRSMLYGNTMPSPELGEGARAAAEKALALSPQLPKASMALGVYHRSVTRDFERAVNVLRRGLETASDDVDLLRNIAFTERERGQPQEAIAALERAAALDPRSWQSQNGLAALFLDLHRPRDARAAAERGLAIAPANISLLRAKAVSYVQEGNLAGARAAIAAAPKEIDTAIVVAEFASYGQAWILDASHRDLLLRLTPAPFGDDRATWAHALGREHRARGNLVEADKYAELAREAYVESLEKAPANGTARLLYAEVLAMLGRDSEAAEAVLLAIQSAPAQEQDPVQFAQLLRISSLVHVQLGERDEAVDVLERVIQSATFITPAYLRIDPTYDPLRGHPRFERLVKAAG